MDKLLGFVAPLIRSAVIPMFTVAGTVLGTAQKGVENVAKMSEEKKRTSGVIALILGWMALDPSVLNTSGMWISRIGEWMMDKF